MQEPVLSSKFSSLSNDQKAASVAAAGVLWGLTHNDFANLSQNKTAILEQLIKILNTSQEKKEKIVTWKEPAFLFKTQMQDNMDFVSLADIWQQAVHQLPGPYRLELHLKKPENLSWTINLFDNHNLQIGSFYSYLKSDSSVTDWRWPVRLGFLDKMIGEKLVKWENVNPSMDKVCDKVDPSIYGNEVDVLFLSSFIETLAKLTEMPLPIQANCLVFFGMTEVENQLCAEYAPQLQKMTGANAIITTSKSIETMESWLSTLFDKLSKNQNLDQILKNLEKTEPELKTHLFTSPKFLNEIKPSTIESKNTSIIQLPTELIEELKHAKPAGSIGNIAPSLGGGLGHLGEIMAFGSRPRGLGGGGGGGGSGFGRGYVPPSQARELRHAENAPVGAPPEPEEVPEPRMAIQTNAKPKGSRSLQGQLFEESKICEWPKDRFIPGKDYLLQIQIAAPDPDWLQVTDNFPDELLTPSSTGHKLRVEFIEPNHFNEVYKEYIYYPKSGPSTICSFPFRVNKKSLNFDGHINVYHKNRLLQSAFLRGPVSVTAFQEPKREIEFGLEFTTRTPDSDLNKRTSYNGSFIVYRDINNQKYLDISSDKFAKLIKLEDIQSDRDYLSNIMNQPREEKTKAFSINSETTKNILVGLAQNGHELYLSISENNKGFKKYLDKAKHIQVVLKSENDFFPIDYFYTKEAPLPEANLCPKAAESVSIGKMCTQPCLIAHDQEEYNICPMAFWGLNRVIEWQTPKSTSIKQSQNNEPTVDNDRLPPISKILFGKSNKIFASDIEDFIKCINEEIKAQVIPVKTWEEWKEQVNSQQPETLILMVHTEQKNGLPTMELEGKPISSANITKKYVDNNNQLHPLVLLLGCGTHESDVPAFNLVKHFRDANASIVIGTNAQLEYYDAPLLAKIILKVLAEMRIKEHATIGEVMLKIKRQTLLNESPMALALVAYGDADWRV